MTTTETSDAPPDWSRTTTELTCPLCEYNLRGLTEPRCPECGFGFRWAELLDGLRSIHPYLFEHQPSRNVRSFLATYWHTSFPLTFWRDLSPAHPVRPRRLILYYFLANLPLTLMLLVAPVEVIVNIWPRTAFVGPGFASPIPYGIPPAPPTILDHLQNAWKEFQTYPREFMPSLSLITALAWPWLTLATLLIFQTSMRRAKINRQHVLRTVIYGCDFSFILLVLLLPELAARLSVGWALLVAVVCGAITMVRVTVAYSRYLRFHMPFWTVFASQTILMLIALIVCCQMVV